MSIRNYFRGAVLGAFVLIGLIAAPARAAEILEEGPGYHVIAYEAGYDSATGGIAGWVALRVESPVVVSSQTKVLTTIHSISPSPGWTYTVKKAGGYDSSVEVDFQSNTGCSARFKALYRPGKTVIDGGKVVCR